MTKSGELVFVLALLTAIPVTAWQAYMVWFKAKKWRKMRRILLDDWEEKQDHWKGTEYIRFLMLLPRRRIAARRRRLESDDWIESQQILVALILLAEIGLLIKLVVSIIRGS
jgi:hypothetical protein